MSETLTMKHYTHPAIIDTLLRIAAPNPSLFSLWMARTFGVRRTVTDWKRVVIAYYWRGRYYITFNGEYVRIANTNS